MKYLIYSFIFLILVASTCKKESDTCHRRVTIKNQSGNSIFVDWGSNYPDTILRNEFPSPLSQPQQYEVLPSEINSQGITTGGDCFESRFKSQITSGTLMIYVFDKTVLQNNPWDSIKKYSMYLKRYDLSLQDLQNKDWTITYP
jgi:hypothetical protein